MGKVAEVYSMCLHVLCSAFLERIHLAHVSRFDRMLLSSASCPFSTIYILCSAALDCDPRIGFILSLVVSNIL